MEKVPRSVLALSALATSTMACSGSEFIFSNDPVISGIRGAVGAAALGVEAFGIGPLINAPTNRNIPLGCIQYLIMAGVPIVAGLISAEYPLVGYGLLGIAFIVALTEVTSRRE